MKLLAALAGALRFGLAMVMLLIFTVIILLTAWMPIEVRGVRLAAWLTTAAARLAMLIFGVRYRCVDAEAIRRHRGFVFANHTTYFDILALVHVMPLRFLAKSGIRKLPLIGAVAAAIGTVFVDREQKASRAEARRQIGDAPAYPPLALFPEGGIGKPGGLQPFRYGAFEISAAFCKPFLPVVIQYSHPMLFHWGDESLWHALWRVAGHLGGRLAITVTPLGAVSPPETASGEALAHETRRAMAAALGIDPPTD
ncbi:MAG: 1-acyl-sn-glycerol-3-phosphate acyltransferase [Thermoflexales bacterium]|nr:1-acyl-sn-glycerol-3-phosphate acyltransferase [Thermoflexales bacterium]